jgi:ribosome-associated protein
MNTPQIKKTQKLYSNQHSPKIELQEKPPLIDKQIDFTLNTEFITLVSLLKASGLASSGGQAKWMVSEGSVWVDQVLELRKSCKIRAAQRVQVGTSAVRVLAAPSEIV